MSLTLVQSIAARDTDKHKQNRPAFLYVCLLAALFSKIWGIKKKRLGYLLFYKKYSKCFLNLNDNIFDLSF